MEFLKFIHPFKNGCIGFCYVINNLNIYQNNDSWHFFFNVSDMVKSNPIISKWVDKNLGNRNSMIEFPTELWTGLEEPPPI